MEYDMHEKNFELLPQVEQIKSCLELQAELQMDDKERQKLLTQSADILTLRQVNRVEFGDNQLGKTSFHIAAAAKRWPHTIQHEIKNEKRNGRSEQCKKHSEVESLDSINKAYEIIVPKVCHARFGSVFRQWKAENVIKHENVALRTKLKAGADKKRKSVESATVTPGLATAKKARNEEAESDVAEANVNIENMTC
ncbi:hypothetical protein THAOC_36105 [Thalassiosira oceanica]|uniref:Uncharacterized protein n=1 Tax=Thalassiosira oceanica TaxID=159749 RepID=K0R0S5_THAOC|nr:hypothetical protein THAOC_36105 [Thalassiosira oceanica]|eukprot:EJK45285.1 hypothetical protein THAOC_36105 [Thalassiosira oceanica]